MRKLVFAALAASLSAAAGPVEPTTLTDGQPAAQTQWYTMQIAAAGYYLNDVETDGYMPLVQTDMQLTAGNLWCFVGSDAAGYTIYNKAAGTAKSLAGPTAPSGQNGGTGYVTLKAPGVSGQCYLWNFTQADANGIEGCYYMNEQGYPANRINNRTQRLAFWTTGADKGSSVKLTPIITRLDEQGALVVSNDPLITLSGSAPIVANADGTFTLGAGTYEFQTPEGVIVNSAAMLLGDGTAKTIRGRGESNAQVPVVGPLNVQLISVGYNAPLVQPQKGYAVFRFDGTPSYNIVYRIPAIATVGAGPNKGRLVAVNDYRYCGGDIGGGRIDLHISYSDDNGQTWSVPDDVRNAQGQPVARGTGAGTPAGTKQSETNRDCGFGDPAILSDRETGELLLVACCGRMNFFSSRRADPQPSARWWSKDGGMTWTEPDYGQWEQIYALFDDNCTHGYIDGQFIGSGRMVQSSRIKVGTHYRIYAVMSGRHNESGNISNWVLYSDDFGKNWHILGDPYNPACASGADEPKCEELPDGSLMLAARGNGGGRNFNIFHYTDIENAKGRWDNCINTNLGTGHGINACNGEIMILPVENVATGQKAYMAVQSFTNSGSREKVSLAWKVLASPADYDEPKDFHTWNGFYQLTARPSAYSTMTLQDDHALGVLYEETVVDGKNYCEVYQRVTVEDLTGGQWKYAPDTDKTTASAHQAEAVANMSAKIDAQNDKIVGNLAAAGKDLVAAAANAYNAAPSDETYADFCAAYLLNPHLLTPQVGATYTFLSDSKAINGYPTTDRFLAANASTLITATTPGDNTNFILVAGTADNKFYIQNTGNQTYIQSTPAATQTKVPVTASKEQAGEYTFQLSPGQVVIVSDTPGNATYPAIHMDSGSNPVIWGIAAPASKWIMTLVKAPESSIAEIAAEASGAPVYDLQGRRVAKPASGQIYIQNSRKFRL